MNDSTLFETYRNNDEARQKLRASIAESTLLLEKTILSLALIFIYLAMSVATTRDISFIDINQQASLPLIEMEIPVIGLFAVAPILLATVHSQVLFLFNQHVKSLNEHTLACTMEELEQLPYSMLNTLPKLHGYRYTCVLLFQWTLLVLLPVIFMVIIQYRSSAFRNIPISFLQTLTLFADVYIIRKLWCVPKPSGFLQRKQTFGSSVCGFLAMREKTPFTHLAICFISFLMLASLLLQQFQLENLHGKFIGRIALLGVDILDLEGEQIITNQGRSRLRNQNLNYANLIDSEMVDVDMTGATLKCARLRNSVLRGSTLIATQFYYADLRGADLRLVNMQEADLRGADLSYANLSGADLSGANLSGANLSNAILYGTNFTDTTLTGANLDRAKAVAAMFTGSKMQESSLLQTLLICSSMASADLTNANMQHSNCQGVDFMDAILNGVNLSFSRLQGAYMGFVQVEKIKLNNGEVNGLVFHPMGSPLSSVQANYIDYKSQTDWDSIRVEHIRQLEKIDPTKKRATFFENMLDIAEKRCGRQLDFDFEDANMHQKRNIHIEEEPQDMEEEILILTVDLPQVHGPIIRRANMFSRKHTPINVHSVEMNKLTEIVSKDVKENHKYTGYILSPNWISEHTDEYFQDLYSWVDGDEELDFENIFPLYRHANACYEDQQQRKKLYAIPLDGDLILMYYHLDKFENQEVPKTWSDYLQMAQKLNQKQATSIGSVIANSADDASFYLFWSVIHPYIQSQGIQQGSFFDKVTMEPLIDNDAFRAALKLYLKILAEGSNQGRDIITLEKASDMFISGQASMTIHWSDLGTRVEGVDSKIRATMLPGSSYIWNRDERILEPVTNQNAPYAFKYEKSYVNHAPYAANNGWSGVIRDDADPSKRRTVYEFFVYMSARQQSQEDVASFKTGINPYRQSHLFDNPTWRETESLSSYLGAMRESLEHPNIVMDLQIKNAYKMLAAGFKTIIHPKLVATLPDSAEDDILQASVVYELTRNMNGWLDKNNRAFQHKDFKASLNLQPCPTSNQN